MKAGWKTKSLSEVCTFKPQKSEVRAKLTSEDEVSFVPMENLGIGSKELTLNGTRPLADVAGSYTYFADGDVLLAKITPCFENGKLGIARNLVNGVGFGSSEYIVIRPSPEVDADFLYHFLDRATFREEGAKQMTGAVGHKRVPKEYVEGALIPVPTIEEQRRIVTLLDEAFVDIATAKANAEKNLQNAEALFQSQLTTLFNRRTKNVTHTTLGQATGGIFTGPFGSLLHKQDYVENGTPLVNPAHISQNGIEPDYRKTVSAETAKRLASYIMRIGDIVIGRRGEMGRCALVTETEDGWLCGTGSFFIKPSPRCDAGYLVHLLRSDQCKQQLENIAGGAVMPNLSNTDLSNFALELPTVDDQKQIVVEIEEAKESVERLKSIYRQKLTALDDLKKSLLHQAFSGQL